MVADVIEHCGLDYDSGSEDQTDYSPDWRLNDTAAAGDGYSDSLLEAFQFESEHDRRGTCVWKLQLHVLVKAHISSK